MRRRPQRPADPEQSVFDLARALSHEEVEWETARVAPCGAPEAEAELLGLAAGTPVLRLDLVGISRHGIRAFEAREYHSCVKFSYDLIRTVPRR